MSDPTTNSAPSLFDPLPPIAKSTSTLAAEAAVRTTSKRRRQILDTIREAGPLSLFELADRLGVHAHQISGRITDLKRDGLIQATGERRINRATGCQADVYRLSGGGDAL